MNKNQTARDAVVKEFCKELNLSSIGKEYERKARQARAGELEYESYLCELLEDEVHGRRERAIKRMTKEARFPEVKMLEQLDWSVLKGVKKNDLMELSSCEYIDERRPVVIVGPIGTGKTHLAIGLGMEAIKRRFRVQFTRAAELVRGLVEAREEKELQKLMRRYERVDLLIVDELGFVPFDRHEGELLFNLLSSRYERGATVVTSNLAFSEWVDVFQNEKLTTALLDRLAHNGHILTTKGKSFRTHREKE